MQRTSEPALASDAAQVAMRRPNVWLRLASSGWDKPQVTVEQREAVRRSQLTAWILLGLLAADLLLTPAGLSDIPTLTAIALVGVGILVGIAVNRLGYTTAAGILLIVLIVGAIVGAISGSSGGLQLVDLPAYDLLVIAIIIAASILPPISAFIVAAINVAVIVGHFLLVPHGVDLAAQDKDLGLVAMLARPVALQVVIASVAFLWVHGTQEQIRRADRAEEVAQLESVVADQKRALDQGVQELTQAFVRAANGDYNVRVNIPRQNPLWSLGAQMNTFIQRLQQAGQASFELERTRQEAFRLAAALDDWRAGRMPLWPAPSGTVLDAIIQRLSGGSRG
ncbi:MAG TPA: hypothetical protein VE338_03125 [Ktedonobacterales bacterium]|nr:hypothetical protein [Ktedonobacterales bacterium]